MGQDRTEVVIDGLSLSIQDVVDVARKRLPVRLDSEAVLRVKQCRAVVDRLVESETKVYGLTTGFGSKRDIFIERAEVRQLQKNLIMSHAVGVGKPLAEDQARATMLLRANTLARGVSGVRVELLQVILDMLNAGVYPYIPEKGSLGASGDLAPLSHLALVVMGHPAGRVYEGQEDGLENSRGEDTVEEPWIERFVSATPELLKERFNVTPLELEAKEGLALNNGTQMMTGIGVLTLHDAEALVRLGEVACAASVEALKGVTAAFDERLHGVRPFPGQISSAANLRNLIKGSDILQLELNMAQVTRGYRSLGEAVDILKSKQTGTALEALQVAMSDLERLHVEPEVVLQEELANLDVVKRSKMTLRQAQLAAFRRGLRPAQKNIEGAYRELLGLELSVEALPAQDALTRALLALENAVPSQPRVQDNYSIRCMPQVAGAVRQTLAHVREGLEVEINAATDNPLIFAPPFASPEETLEEYQSRLVVKECVQAVSSGGNFHGEPVAFLMDFLSIGIAELGSISERRTAQMTDGNLNNGLPSLLIWKSGLNSGFMIPQYTAASLVSENKGMTHPASTDSIPSCENTEDHVSMGGIAARKARDILENVEYVIAIEILNAFQALFFRRPFRPGPATCALMAKLQEEGLTPVEEDRPLHEDMILVFRLLRRGALLSAVEDILEEPLN